jgi:DNA-binding transcriptional LysR family regulator
LTDIVTLDVSRYCAAEELHFTRAARRMGITQSSLSAAIQRLEAEQGISLLRRSTRRVALTPDGRRVLREARALLRAVDRFTSPPQRTHALRIGTCPPGRAALIDAIVAECVQTDFGDVVSVREEFSGALLRALDDGERDVAVTLGTNASGPGREVERLATVPLQVALARDDPRSERARLELRELADMTLYVFGDDDTAGSRAVAVQACRSAGFEPELYAARFAYSEPPLRSGRMFALMPSLPAQPLTSNVALVPLAEPAPTISFDIVWRDDGGDAVESFIDAARRVRARRGWAERS